MVLFKEFKNSLMLLPSQLCLMLIPYMGLVWFKQMCKASMYLLRVIHGALASLAGSLEVTAMRKELAVLCGYKQSYGLTHREGNRDLLPLVMGTIQLRIDPSFCRLFWWLWVAEHRTPTEPQRKNFCFPIASSATVIQRVQPTSKGPKKTARLP